MGKKFTLSLLVLAATLLALPIQAQNAFVAKKALPSKVMKDVKGRETKKVYSFASLNGKQSIKEVVARAKLDAKEKAEVERIELAKLWNRNMSRVQERKNYNQKPNQFREFIAIQIPNVFEGVDRQAQPVVSRSRRTEEGSVTPPATASVETWYTTNGAFYIYSQGSYVDASSYMKTVNVAIDGSDIYIQGLGYWFKEGWIKGSIDATTATFSNSQIIGEDEYGPEYIVGSNDGVTLSDNIVFNYDAANGVLAAVTTLILENAEADEVAPYCYWNQPSFSKTEPQGPAVVVVPEGVEAVDYVMSYTTGSTPVKVAVDGNDVYFQGMSNYIPDAWVKGTKDGNNVTFEANQYVGEYAGYESFFFYNSPATFVYDADADTYSATGHIFGVLGGQYYDGNYTNPVLNRVVEKAATPANPVITDLKNGNYGYYIVFNVPLQDTEGNPLVASKLSYEIFTDVNQEVSPLTFTPATHSKLTENMTIIPYGFTEGYDFYDTQIYFNDLYSDSWNKIGIKSIYTGGGETHETEIQWYTIKPYGEPEATTAANVDALPYENALNSADLFGEFGVLDSNNDNRTWSVNTRGAQYSYSSANDADDWLISPAIKLEAGKKYHFAIDAAAAMATYPERLEVKLGTEPKASAFTTEVIPATVIDFTDFQTLENEAVVVGETGYYHFGIHAISDKDEYNLYVTNFLVEAGVDDAAPAAVTDFDVVATAGKLEATISFKAPVLTAGGQELASIDSINVKRDGKAIVSLKNVVPGADAQYVDAAEDLTIGAHVYQVIAYNAAGAGVKSEEKSVFLSAVLNVPTSFDLTQQSVFDLFQVIDANEDDETWSWSSSYGTNYSYSESLAANDYLISAPVKFEAGKNYKVVVSACAASSNYPEAFRVLVGKEATIDGLNILVADTTWVETKELEDYESEFTATEDGDYNVAIQAVSPANMWRLNVAKLSIEKGADPKAPAAVDEFKVMAGENGAQWAVVSFNAPANAIDGTDLTENMSVDILRGDSLIATLEDVEPGTFANYKDEDAEAGFNTYQVIARNSYGTGKKSDKVKVYVGLDTPADLEGLTATDKATSIDFAWNKVGNVGVNGGFVNPAAVDYEVWSLKLVESMFGYGLDYDELKASVTDTDNYTLVENTDEGVQDYKYWCVQPVNNAGVGSPAVASLLVGAPYELPLVEGFAGKAFHYIWDYSNNTGIFVSEESTDDDNVALQLVALDEPGTVTFTSGKVSLKNVANPTLLFDVKSSTISKINVIGSVAGAEFTTIKADAPVSSEYTTVKVPLNDLKNARFVQVGFSADFANPTIESVDWETSQYVYTWGDLLNIDNIRIVDLYEHDVEVALSAPASVVAGNAAKLQVKVSNNAENAANGFTLKLTAGEKEIYNQTFNEALKPFSSIDVEAAFETTVFDEVGDVTLKAEVEYENDLNLDNNIDEAVITVKEPTAVAPSNLVAEQTAEQAETGEVTLTWTAPAAGAPAEVTEDFDDETVFVPFSLGGITADEHTGAFGDWTLYDGNGLHVYGFDGLSFTNASEVQAWQVVNPAMISEQFAETYPAHSGNQFLWSFCPADQDASGNNITPAADHWLISPELPGAAQTIGFYARAITDQYGAETFEVLASSTDKNPSSFAIVGSAYSTTEKEWKSYSVDLPAGTKYFAIRHTAQDIFGLLVDDITYATGSVAPESFNIYVDAAAVGNTTETTATLKELAAGNYVFAVTAVYANGAESKPVTATLDVTNAISEILNSGKSFTIYTVDGKLINRQATSLKDLKGAYIINNKKVILK